ncbi:DNA-cytosine methyltransferase [Haloferax prahovense DSM 18310]|uniref:DNA (cytosine-5-)-methyltransferase n=1 Tax=Haloferax prahovense (strain DSM 18310 / JCM 13924 / TL6) TaxID=1227461 RepID=M0GAN1_HALPT|nr:DNA cytosine methyltransferase [Haloferax prahovense]ELZ68572.1 DNA-cytosine methyltransferase [Haloferax prahovense DSM 18310]
MSSNLAAVDLFCGVGGLTHGLEQAGIPVAAGVEINPNCRYPYEANNDAEFVEADVSDIDSSDVESLFPDDSTKILAGCAPCQPFSNLNNGRDTSQTSEYSLLQSFGELVEDIQPAIVTMENVAEVRNEPVYSDFVNTLFREGYQLWFDKVSCPDYGIPQRRNRIVLLASKLGDVSLIDPTHDPVNYPTVREVIGDLPPIEAGEYLDEDHLHKSRTLEEQNLERIGQSLPGGTWRDWDPDIRLDCHRKESGRSFDSVYGRMEWDAPAPTMTTQYYNYGSGRFGHPEQDRAISLREGAMLQTFPEDYDFVEEGGDVEFKKIGKMVGNAVPVRLGEVIGRSIVDHVEEHDVAA